MTITSGFFDSNNGDRTYNADEMSALFEGIITDGVFEHIGNAFLITLTGPRQISIGSGKAWLKNKWISNSSNYSISIPSPPNAPNSRIDAIVLKIDTSQANRSGSIAIVSGAAAQIPSKPSLSSPSAKVTYMPLCYVTSHGGQDSLSAGDIESCIGGEECPFITAPLQTIDLTSHFALWQQAFEAWLSNLNDELASSGNQAANLQSQINALANRVTPIDKGGTGGSTKSSAKTNLGIRYGTDSPSSIADQLDEGDIYIYIT